MENKKMFDFLAIEMMALERFRALVETFQEVDQDRAEARVTW